MQPAVSDAFVFIEDITNGQENVKISFINTKNFKTILKSVCYVPDNILTSDTLAEDFESIPLPCKCENTCENTCPCTFKSNIAYTNDSLSEEFTYDTARPIIECSSLCSCGDHCPTRVVQKGIKIPLQVFMTDQKEFGVQTLQFIPKRTFVCEYAGELIDKLEAQKRMKCRSIKEPNYIFVLKEFSSDYSSICTIVDPTKYGNVGRYLNHSCNPNLVTVPVRANSMIPRLCFFAKRDIEPLEELTYNYGIGVPEERQFKSKVQSNNVALLEQKKCYCNSVNCLGFLPFDVLWLC